MSALRTPYQIRDASGTHLATHVRFDDADGKRMVWELPTGGSGLGGLSAADLPLYGIERLGANVTVIVCEGEKAADALIGVGIPAVGTVTGASSTPNRGALAELGGRSVVLWPDNDDVGQGHMKRIARGLAGIASSVRWADWPAAPPHGDAADCIAVGGKDAAWDVVDAALMAPTDRFERRGLGYFAHYADGEVDMTFDHFRRSGVEMNGELAVVTTDPAAPEDGHLLQGSFNVSAMRTRDSIAKLCADRAPSVHVDWRLYLERFCRRILDAERQGSPVVIVGNRPRRPALPYMLYPLLVENKATILFGPEGAGKSYLAAAAAVSVRSGETIIPGWTPIGRQPVLVLDWEDDEDEWNDRLARIAAGKGISPVDVAYRYGRGPLVEDVEEIARIVAAQGGGLIIVDSVSKAAPPGREGADPSDTANRLFAALRYIGGTCLLLDHVPKATGKAGAERPYGSVMKPAWARVTFELARADDDDNRDIGHLVLTNRKRNSGPRTPPLGFIVDYSNDHVIFRGEEPVAELISEDRGVRAEIDRLLGDGTPRTYVEIGEALGRTRYTVEGTMKRVKGQYAKLIDPLGITRWGCADTVHEAPR